MSSDFEINTKTPPCSFWPIVFSEHAPLVGFRKNPWRVIRRLSENAFRVRTCKSLRSPGIDFASLQYVAWRAGTTNRVIVPGREPIYKGWQNRFLGIDSLESISWNRFLRIYSLESIPEHKCPSCETFPVLRTEATSEHKSILYLLQLKKAFCSWKWQIIVKHHKWISDAKPIMYLVIQVQLGFNVCKALRNFDIWSTASCPNGSKLFHDCRSLSD